MRHITRPRQLYYGWYITLALAITETISYGVIYYAFSVYLAPMEADLGWTRTQLTGAFSLSLLVSGVMAVPVGIWVDKHGARALMSVGSVAASVLVFLWSRTESLPVFYIIWALLGVCAASVFYEPAFAVIANWFVRSRSRALTMITLVAGFSSTIFLPLSDRLLIAFGWRGAVAALALLLAVTTIPLHVLVLRRRPADLGLWPDGEQPSEQYKASVPPSTPAREAFRSENFWWLTLAFGLVALAAAAIRVHFIPYLIERDVDPSTAAFASGAIGAMQVAGRLVFAPLDSRLSKRMLVMSIFSVQLFAALSLVLVTATWGIGLFVLAFGASFGALTLIRPSLIAELYGSAQYGRISSVMALFLTIAGTAAPVGAGILYDRSGSYDLVVLLVILFTVLSIGVLFLLRIDARSLPQIETDPLAGQSR